MIPDYPFRARTMHDANLAATRASAAATYWKMVAQEAEARVRELEAALSRAVDLLDECLGDTDLPDDDRPDFRAMQTLTAVLGKDAGHG
jgi:hypothetical protein